MAKIDFLFQLIKSMDKNEKRFFKLYSNLYNTKKGLYYIILFDILDKMENFDSEEVEQKLKDKKVPIHLFALIKRYLKVQILECMSVYHRNNMNTIKFFNTIGQATILSKKKHYPEALKLLVSLNQLLFQQS